LYEQIKKIAQNFKIEDIELYVSDGLILVGLKRTITRLKMAPKVRPQVLAAGFKACANTTVQVVLFPNSDQRRILGEMLPEIPSESGNVKITTLSKDLHWAALGFNGPPSISLNVTIQSPNAEGADRMLTFIKNLYALAGQYNEARPFIPELDQVLKWLTPRKHGKRLLLEVDSITADSIINEFLAPSLTKARTRARRIACANNLRNIGRALLMYANDNKDNYPPDLETLVTKTYIRDNKMLICPATKLRDFYIYRGVSITTSDIPMMIMVYEKLNNHGGGRNVLFLDCHVEWVSEERFQELIKKDNDYRRKRELPVLPAQ
jgi:prepilin-type processing-associated H-X9-DG protein